MRESGYYPPGAEFDQSAPWNQHENEEKDFNVTISQSLSKDAVVYTTNYNEEYDCDEEGEYYNVDTSEVSWQEEYEKEHLTPMQLISTLKTVLEMQLEGKKINPNRAKHIIEECEDWVIDDYEIVEN